MAFPAEGLNLFFMSIYGGFGYSPANSPSFGPATGLAQSGNPPYAVSDFLGFYPQFGTIDGSGNYSGIIPINVLQSLTNIANASLMSSRWREQWTFAMALHIAHFSTLWLQTSAPIVQQQFETVMHGEAPAGDSPGTVYTLSAAPSAGLLQSLTKNGIFLTPGVDYSLNANVITLTVATVVGDNLYAVWPVQQLLQTNVPQTANQVAAAGAASGILTSKSVGDVSAGYNPLAGMEEWGAWNLTKFGQQLITMARVVGAGLIYVR